MAAPDLINERAQTHGDFTDMASTAQGLKAILHNTAQWGQLTAVQRESVEMIVHKIGRLTAGNPNHRDHWEDIIGYAKMALDRIPQKKAAVAALSESNPIEI